MDKKESNVKSQSMFSNNYNSTVFDSLISNKQIQIIKAAIPYVSISQQKFISVYVQIEELKNTMQLFQQPDINTVGICSIPDEEKNPDDMINAIKCYCDDAEKEFLDIVLNFMSAFRLYNTYKGQSSGEHDDQSPFGNMNPINAMKSMLSPEQQAMFDTYSSLMTEMNK